MTENEAIEILNQYSIFQSLDYDIKSDSENIISINLIFHKENIHNLKSVERACNRLSHLEEINFNFNDIKIETLNLNLEHAQEISIKNVKLTSLEIVSEKIFSMTLENIEAKKIDFNKLKLPELNSLYFTRTIITDELILTNNESLYLEFLEFKNSDINFDIFIKDWKYLKEIIFDSINIKSFKIRGVNHMQYISISQVPTLESVIIQDNLTDMLDLKNCPNIQKIEFENARIFDFIMDEGHQCKSLELFDFLKKHDKYPKLLQETEIVKQLF